MSLAERSGGSLRIGRGSGGSPLPENVLAMADLGEHQCGVLAHHADGLRHARQIGAQEGIGLLLLAEQRGPVASPRARAASTEAQRAMSWALSVSTVTAKRALDWVYSWAQ